MKQFISKNIESLYYILMNKSDVGMLIVAESGDIIDINNNALNILGSPSKELTLKINLLTTKALINIGLSSSLINSFNQLIDTSGESKYITFWGKELYLKYKIFPIEINNKKLAKIILEDISEQMNREKKFKINQEIIKNTFNALDDLIIVIDKDYNLVTSNWQDISTLANLGEVNKCHMALTASDIPCNNCKAKYVFQSKGTVSYESSDNYGKHFEIKLIPIYDSNGDVEFIIEHYHDVSVRKNNELKLKKLAMAIEKMSEVIVITDPEGNIEYVNPAFTKISGYEKDEVIGKNPNALSSGIHNKKFYQVLWNTIKSGKTWRGEFTNKRRDGSFYNESASISPVLNDNHEIINFIAVKRDITKEILMKNQLNEAQKLESIGILSSGIAHEINTPLQYIIDNLTFIIENFNELRKYRDAIHKNLNLTDEIKELQEDIDISFIVSEIPKALDDTLKGTEIIQNIVKSMRTFSHTSKDKQVTLEINNYIKSAIEISRNSWKNIVDLELNLKDNLPKLKINIGQINQVILNLIVNAVDAIKLDKNHNKKTNKIMISTFVKDKFLVISIQDTGIGINDQDKYKVFDPFFTTKGVGKGSGQGLSISYDIIVNKHKGNLYFKTKKYKGTTFFIELPVFEEV